MTNLHSKNSCSLFHVPCRTRNRGFTLVEVVVAVGIIVILATLIVINSNISKNKAKDVLIKEIMGNTLFNLAVEYYVNHGGYGAFCNNDATEDILDKIISLSNPQGSCQPDDKNNYRCCHAQEDKWAICAQLHSGGGTKGWCADYTGARKEINFSECTKPQTKSCN